MEQEKFENKIDNFIEFLEESLPQTDTKHLDEVLDIAELLKQRALQYVRNYGLN